MSAVDTKQTTDAPVRGREALSPVQIPATGWKDIAIRLKQAFGRDHVTLTSAGVAFFGFTALVPFLAAGLSIYGLLADPSDVITLVDRIDTAVPSEVAEMIRQQLQSVADASTGALGLATLVSIVLALWSASAGMSHLIEAMNIAFNEDPDERSWFRRKALSLGMTIGLIGLVAASAVLVSIASRIQGGAAAVVQLFVWSVIAVFAGVAVAVLYRYGPDRRDARWRWVAPGTLFAVIAVVVVSYGFSLYVARFGSYNETYGSLGAIVVILTWLYLSTLVVVLGAEINAEAEHQTALDSTVEPDRPRGERGAYMADTIGASH